MIQFQQFLDQLELPDRITRNCGKFHLVWQYDRSGFSFFKFQDQNKHDLLIRDDADYLLLFMKIGEQLFRQSKDQQATYICACTLGGERLLVKQFDDGEQKQFKYSYIALSHAIKQLSNEELPAQLNFFAELSYEKGDSEFFVKEAAKMAKILKGQNKEDWQLIADHQSDFLKTDLYVFSLQRLHSWGFQAVKPEGIIDEKCSMVRPVMPKPRGATRKGRSIEA